MNTKEYIEEVLKTESIDFDSIRERLTNDQIIRLDHASDGICTEAGELKDNIKKHVYYGKGLDVINLEEEIGDLLWYIMVAVDAIYDILGLTAIKDSDVGVEALFSHIMEMNIEKLRKRYKGKFNKEGAVNRDLDAERVILENPRMSDLMKSPKVMKGKNK